jgi:urease accessory protein
MTTVTVNPDQRESRLAAAGHGKVIGSLDLDFEFDARSASTIMSRNAQKLPLRVVRSFRLGDGSALVHLHNVSGGLLGGDSLSISANVGGGACVQVTTTGATRVYRSKGDRVATTQFNRFSVAENGLLEYVPDAIIPYAKAQFCQETTIDLAAGAGLFCWEVLAPGRSARGEVFEYECVNLKTDLRGQGRSIATENVRLQPNQGELAAVARLGPYRYWVTFYIVRVGLDPGVWLAAEGKLREAVRPFLRPGEALWGVSTLAADGLAVRGLARSGWELMPALQRVWTAAKQLLYGREPIPPRKVN